MGRQNCPGGIYTGRLPEELMRYRENAGTSALPDTGRRRHLLGGQGS